MYTDQTRAPTLEIAHVLFMDIVAYSKLPIDEQERVLQQLQKLVSSTADFGRAEASDQLIRLPTGDGIALVFFGDPEAPVRCAVELSRALRSRPGIELRMGIHTGPVYRVEDINANRNVAGGGINIAQRVMDCGDAGHILISSAAADVLGQLSSWTDALHDLGDTEVKHGVRIRLFNLYKANVGNPELPQKTRSAMALRRRVSRKQVVMAVLALAVSAITVLAPRITKRIWLPAPAKPITLAVLPFRMLNAPGEIGLSTGIPDAIINLLAPVVRLRPTEAILRYENQNLDPEEVGRRLRSDYVLTGTIQKAGERFRVSVQLVRVEDGRPLWGEHYDMERQDLLGLQDNIAGQVTSKLKIRLTEAEKERLYRRYTENGAAYELYLKGRAHLVRHKEESIRAAVEAFEGALQHDPNYALAHAGLAMASAEMPSRFAPQGQVKSWGERAKQEATRALELDPNLAEAHQALAATYRKAEYNWDGTIEESHRALELNPSLSLPHYYLAGAFYHMGLLELGEEEVRSGLEINPEDRVEARRTQGVIAVLGSRFADAVPLFEEVQRLSAKAQSDLWLARAYYYLGQRSRSEAMMEELSNSSAASTAARAKAELASFLAARGELARAEALLRTVTESPYMDHHVAYSLGVAYAQLGQDKDAVRWLRQAVDTGFPCYPWYARDPLLQPLRGDPEFQQFLEKLRQSWESAKARYARKRG